MATRAYGYLKLSRKMFDTDAGELWSKPRCFSEFEAWLDLIQLAPWADHHVITRGVCIEVPRGCFIASVRMLGRRWQWPTTRVFRFLRQLQDRNSIRNENGTVAGTLYRLVKYDTYNPPRNTDRNEDETVDGTKGIRLLGREDLLPTAGGQKIANEEDGVPAARADSSSLDLATFACVVANSAHDKRFPHFTMLVPSSDTVKEVADAWEAAGVSRETIEAKISDMIAGKSKPVSSLRYFRDAVLEAWEVEQGRTLASAFRVGVSRRTASRPPQRGEQRHPQRYAAYETDGNAAVAATLSSDRQPLTEDDYARI